MLTPYFHDDAVKLYHSDCIQGMKELPDGLWGPIVTSPPYCVGKEYEATVTWPDYVKLLAEFYEESFRITKKGGYCIVVFGDNWVARRIAHRAEVFAVPMSYLHFMLGVMAGWHYHQGRIWQKDYATLISPYTAGTTMAKPEWEHIMTFRKPGGGKEKVREQVIHSRGIWNTTGRKQSVPTLQRHVAAFPEALVEMILKVYSDKGDTIIDPFCGSGTTLYVAKLLGRRAIGYEIDEESCRTARLRLMQQIMDTSVEVAEGQEEEKSRQSTMFDFIQGEEEPSSLKDIFTSRPASPPGVKGWGLEDD